MEDFDVIPSDKNLKLFCQERLDALSKALEDDLRDSGMKKILKQMWYEELVKPIQEEMTLDQIINRYGDGLTEQELTRLKEIIQNGKKR